MFTFQPVCMDLKNALPLKEHHWALGIHRQLRVVDLHVLAVALTAAHN